MLFLFWGAEVKDHCYMTKSHLYYLLLWTVHVKNYFFVFCKVIVTLLGFASPFYQVRERIWDGRVTQSQPDWEIGQMTPVLGLVGNPGPKDGAYG